MFRSENRQLNAELEAAGADWYTVLFIAERHLDRASK